MLTGYQEIDGDEFKFVTGGKEEEIPSGPAEIALGL